MPAEDQFTTCYNIPLGSYCPDPPIIINQLEPGVAAPFKVLANWRTNKGFVPGSSKSNPARLVASGPTCVGNSNEWIIGNYSSTTTSTSDDTVQARLIVTDNSGAGLDKFRMAGVTFVPGSSNTGTKKLTVLFSNAFNGRGNTGKYIMGLLIGGNYNGGPGSANLNVGNQINYSGTGVFCHGEGCLPSNIGNTLSSTVTTLDRTKVYGIGVNGTASLQSPTGVPLPSFDCDTGDGTCQPTITQKFDVTVVNQDQLALASSSHTYACFKPDGESDIETLSATTTTPTCRQRIRREMRRDARHEAKALRLVSGQHFTCPVCKEGHEFEDCDDHDNDPD